MAKYISRGGSSFIDSEDKLIDYLKKGAKGFTTSLAKDTAKRLKKNTANLVYSSYTPSKYNRTMELLNSIVGPGFNGGEGTKNVGDGFQAYVGFDSDKITTFTPSPNYSVWGTHVLFDGTSGNDAIEFIVDSFEENGFLVKGKKGNTIFKRKPVHMIAKTIEEVETALSNINREIPDFRTAEMGISVRLNK